jgi:hypothetical protein
MELSSGDGRAASRGSAPPVLSLARALQYLILRKAGATEDTMMAGGARKGPGDPRGIARASIGG